MTAVTLVPTIRDPTYFNSVTVITVNFPGPTGNLNWRDGAKHAFHCERNM